MNEYLKMVRIKDWIKFYPFFPLIGALLANADLLTLILISIAFFCVIGYGFVINNYFDTEIDKKHAGKVKVNKNPLAAGTVTKKGTLMLCGVLLAFGIAIPGLLSLMGLFFTLMSILFLTIYSARYTRLKERYFIDILSHGLMFGLFPFLAGFTLADGDLALFSSMGLAIPGLFVIIGCEALITHQISDYREDLGITDTTIVRIGLKNGWFLLGIIVSLSIIDLEIIAHYFDIGAITNYAITDLPEFKIVIHVFAFIYLIAYPLYMCRDEVKKYRGEVKRCSL